MSALRVISWRIRETVSKLTWVDVRSEGEGSQGGTLGVLAWRAEWRATAAGACPSPCRSSPPPMWVAPHRLVKRKKSNGRCGHHLEAFKCFINLGILINIVISKTWCIQLSFLCTLSVFICTASSSVSVVILNGRRELVCIAQVPFYR